MTDKTPADKIDLSTLRADPEVTETKNIHGIPFTFRTRLPAKTILNIQINSF